MTLWGYPGVQWVSHSMWVHGPGAWGLPASIALALQLGKPDAVAVDKDQKTRKAGDPGPAGGATVPGAPQRA